MKLNTYVVLATSLFFFCSCRADMEIPAYIYVDKVDFIATDPPKEGTSSSKISNIRVTVNGKDIGTYPLPALVPVIASGNTDVKIEAGIKLNGVSQQRPPYPLYKPYTETINLKKGMIDTIEAVFHYYEVVEFPLKEDFESAGLAFSSNTGAALNKTQDTSLLFHYPNERNNFSGIIQLPFEDTVYFFEIKTTSPLRFNSLSATDCFVEINYCFTEDVEIGIYAHSKNSSTSITRQYSICNIIGSSDNMGDHPQWGKIYVNLTDIMANATTAMNMTHFDIYMKCGIPRDKTARFLFDNIKVAHR